MRVMSISNIAVDDSEEISIVSPVNESNKNGTHSSTHSSAHFVILLFLADPCFYAPCENGGTCQSNKNEFTCECAEDWKGKTCSEKG